MKSNRLALIAAICAGGVARPLAASSHDVAEEVALAAAHNDSESTLDEGENITEISTLLADRIETINDEYGDEDLELDHSERKEIGKGALFKAKPSQIIVDDEDAEFRAFKRQMGWDK